MVRVRVRIRGNVRVRVLEKELMVLLRGPTWVRALGCKRFRAK